MITLTPESTEWLAAAAEAEPLPLTAIGYAIAVADHRGRRAVLHSIEPGWVPTPAVWATEAEARAWLREQRPDLVPGEQHPGQ